MKSMGQLKLLKKKFQNLLDSINAKSKEIQEQKREVIKNDKESDSNEKYVIQVDEKQKLKVKRSIGAPIKFSDPLLKATQAVKISALTGILLKVLLENYLTEKTRDEFIRSAIVEYINLNFERDDKKAIINMLEKQVNEIREKYPVKEVFDLEGNILHNKEYVEQQYLVDLKEQLKL